MTTFASVAIARCFFAVLPLLLAGYVVAQTSPIRIAWATPNLLVSPYSTGTLVIALAGRRYGPDIIFQRWEMSGKRLRAVTFTGMGCSQPPLVPECSYDLPPPTVQAFLPPLAPGDYVLEVTNNDGLLDRPEEQTRTLTVAATPPTVDVTTVGFRQRNKFFIAAVATDLDALTSLRDGDGPLWAIAEPITLRAWPAAGPAPSAAKEVCRLYHPTAQTHFFSGNPSDCAAIRGTAPWRDEGIAFRALLPAAGGVCPIGTEPLWRLFSSKFTTHRYTRSSTTYSAFQADGWSGEGVVFCSAPA